MIGDNNTKPNCLTDLKSAAFTHFDTVSGCLQHTYEEIEEEEK